MENSFFVIQKKLKCNFLFFCITLNKRNEKFLMFFFNLELLFSRIKNVKNWNWFGYRQKLKIKKDAIKKDEKRSESQSSQRPTQADTSSKKKRLNCLGISGPFFCSL